jgi:hypothetical protein
MEVIFFTATLLLLLFSTLAIFDGLYLHILKYRLFEHEESKFEHFTHLLRAVIFPLILVLLYIRADETSFWVGTAFVLADLLILGIDAYAEGDSRAFMGGLPRWEYIVHLFVNGFHFAGIAVYYVARIRIHSDSISLVSNFDGIFYYGIFTWLAAQMLPGAILLALVHIVVANKKTVPYWNKALERLSCCLPAPQQ